TADLAFMRALLPVLFAACHAAPPQSPATTCDRAVVRDEIEAQIARSMKANREKDIETFMAIFDDDIHVGAAGPDQVRADILRDWGIIVRFYEVERWITAMESVSADTAVIQTNQLYHRTFSRPNGEAGEDDIVSTQRHRETWRKRPTGWRL